MVSSQISFSNASLEEKLLRNDIMNNYNKEVLPRKNISKPIYLKLGIAIRAFESINQVDGTMDSNIWLRYWWKDRILSWNPQDYGNNEKFKAYGSGKPLRQFLYAGDFSKMILNILFFL